MRVFEFHPVAGRLITEFDSRAAWSAELAHGSGAAHVHTVRMEAGGEIGPHPTGFAQLFLVLSGSGWAAGPDGQRVPLQAGQGAQFERGELHAKGSERGMTALIIQVDLLHLTT